MNACGKKNPEIQKTLGVPPSIQRCRKLTRSVRSCVHDPNGLRDKNPTSAHTLGTC